MRSSDSFLKHHIHCKLTQKADNPDSRDLNTKSGQQIGNFSIFKQKRSKYFFP